MRGLKVLAELALCSIYIGLKFIPCRDTFGTRYMLVGYMDP